MKTEVKRIITKALVCASIIIALINVMPNASAVAIVESAVTQESGGAVSPRTEETTWYVRVYNGKLQRRLWSNTRGIWLTDWMDCP